MKSVPIVNATGTGRRIASRGRRKWLIAFGWYGGKFSHVDFLAPLLPTDATHFCDVFGGSAAVFRPRAPDPHRACANQQRGPLGALCADLQSGHGRAVISGYRTELYDDLFATWHRVDAERRRCHSTGAMRQESARLNFNPESRAEASLL